MYNKINIIANRRIAGFLISGKPMKSFCSLIVSEELNGSEFDVTSSQR